MRVLEEKVADIKVNDDSNDQDGEITNTTSSLEEENEADFKHNGPVEGLSILDLPPEMILRIFVHLDIRTIFKTVIVTCKTFYEILSAKDIWQTVFCLKWEHINLLKDLENVNSWRSIYSTYDDVDNFWRSKGGLKLNCKKLLGHSAPVDAVHVMPGKKFAVSGSRDRSVVVWDIEKFSFEDETECDIKEAVTLSGHTGWVWSVTTDARQPHEVITGSWDKSVKVWDLNKNAENIHTFKYHPSAILTMTSYNGLILSGCYDKKVRSFDPRSEDVQEIIQHKGPILSLIVHEDFVISGSEDKTVSICDRRMTGHTLSSIGIGSEVLSMNLAHDMGFQYLRIGSKKGVLNLYDTSSQNFVLLESYQLWKDHKVLKLENFHGALIACASTGYYRAYTPDRSLKLLGTFHEHTLEISSVHSRNGIMVTGGCDDTVALWRYSKE
eukprot:gene5276-426_t